MLELRDLRAGYGSVEVVQGVDMSVGAGETVAILGPNGAGKSTLLAALTGTIVRRSGTADFDGKDLIRMPSHAIVTAGVTLVPEGRHVFAPFSVRDNLRLGAMKLKRGAGRDLDERFDYVYRLFPRLKERESQLAGTLSGGEQQMLAIGRALMSAPRMLLLDEPFLGLAPLVIEEIRDALSLLSEDKMPLLLIEQKLDVALGLASRAYVLIKGQVVLDDTSANLRKRPDLNDLYFSLAMD